MERRIKDYLTTMSFLVNQPDMVRNMENLPEQMLIQIQFFQHERLVHLIVTVTFAILTMLSVATFLISEQLPLIALTAVLLVLLIPYVRHYFILENGVQKLYEYYNIVLSYRNQKKEVAVK